MNQLRLQRIRLLVARGRDVPAGLVADLIEAVNEMQPRLQLLEAEEQERDEARKAEVASHRAPEYLAGPPDRCWSCWSWRLDLMTRTYWSWHHTYTPIPAMQPVVNGNGELVLIECCMHECHGPEGRPDLQVGVAV